MKQPQLGDYIAGLRKERGLTQEELVEMCNINVRTIQRIEAGEVIPRNYTIKNILEALGSSYEKLTLDLHESTNTETQKKLLHDPSQGMLIGILGILYIIISIPLAIADVTAALGGDDFLNIYTYSTIATIYAVLLCAFYTSLAFTLDTKSQLLKTCVFIFLGLELLSTGFGFYMYQGDSMISATDVGLAVSFQIIYGLSLIILSIPFFYARKQFTGIYQYLGIIAAIAGGCHITFLLFPVGILGFLLFEILLIALVFQAYQTQR